MSDFTVEDAIRNHQAIIVHDSKLAHMKRICEGKIPVYSHSAMKENNWIATDEGQIRMWLGLYWDELGRS